MCIFYQRASSIHEFINGRFLLVGSASAVAYSVSFLQNVTQLENNAETGVLPRDQDNNLADFDQKAAVNGMKEFGGALNKKQSNLKRFNFSFAQLSEQTDIHNAEKKSALVTGIFDALVADNPEMLRPHLEAYMELRNYDINSRQLSSNTDTILIKAVSLNNMRSMNCITMLLKEMRADPNNIDIYGWDALVHASERGNVLLMELLLDYGAKVNRPVMIVNALCRALILNKVESVKLLLKNGANINLWEEWSDKTALIIAYELKSQSSQLIKQHAAAKRLISTPEKRKKNNTRQNLWQYNRYE